MFAWMKADRMSSICHYFETAARSSSSVTSVGLGSSAGPSWSRPLTPSSRKTSSCSRVDRHRGWQAFNASPIQLAGTTQAVAMRPNDHREQDMNTNPDEIYLASADFAERIHRTQSSLRSVPNAQ
jgi:hypothetical protein